MAHDRGAQLKLPFHTVHNSCSEMYKQHPLPKGMSVEEETAQSRAGKGERGKQLSTACPMRTVVERKIKDLDAQAGKQ